MTTIQLLLLGILAVAIAVAVRVFAYTAPATPKKPKPPLVRVAHATCPCGERTAFNGDDPTRPVICGKCGERIAPQIVREAS